MADFLQLDSSTYTATRLTVDVGLPTFVRVSKMMGPGFVRLLADPEFRKKDAAGPEMAALVADLFTRLDDPALMPTVATLMNTLEQDGKPMAQRWNTEFSGRLKTLCTVLLFLIQHHFGDFLSDSSKPADSSSKPESKQGQAAGKKPIVSG